MSIFISTVTRCVPITTFAPLVDIPIGNASSAVALEIVQ